MARRLLRVASTSNRRRSAAGPSGYEAIEELGDWQMFIAADSQPVLSDGTAVVTIDDQYEDIGYTAPSASQRCSYGTNLQNSLPGLEFDGVDDGAYSNASDGSSTADVIHTDVWTWFTVFRFGSTSGWQSLYGDSSTSVLRPLSILLNRFSGGKVNIYSYAGNGYVGNNDTAMSINTTYFLAYVHDYGSSPQREEWYLNGSDDSGSMTNMSFTSGSVTQRDPPYIVGTGGFGVSFGGDVFVMGLCKDALSSGDIGTMHTHLNDIWSYA